jgi:hypothetical protein
MKQSRRSTRGCVRIALLGVVVVVGFVAGPAFGAQTWTFQKSRNPKGSTDAELAGLACTSASNCVAVGSWSDAQGSESTLVERWNGSKWSIDPSPNPKGDGALLSGVSCWSANVCMAVGSYHKGAGMRTLILQWNGSEWTIVPSPNTHQIANILNGVSCVSSMACEAVGGAGVTVMTLSRTLVERWNGSEWTLMKSRNAKGVDYQDLLSVSCSSDEACTAVGFSMNFQSTGLALVERWNGSKWKLQETQRPDHAIRVALAGVSCPSAWACTATGWYLDDDAFGFTLVGRFVVEHPEHAEPDRFRRQRPRRRLVRLGDDVHVGGAHGGLPGAVRARGAVGRVDVDAPDGAVAHRLDA